MLASNSRDQKLTMIFTVLSLKIAEEKTFHTLIRQTGEAEGETQAKVMLALTFGELNNW